MFTAKVYKMEIRITENNLSEVDRAEKVFMYNLLG